jgi:hypothetical protein
MSNDNPRYKAELLEDEGINPESTGDEPKLQPQQLTDPFAIILDMIASIKVAVDSDETQKAKDGIRFVRSMITMGLSMAESRKDTALRAKLEGYRPIIDGLEAQLSPLKDNP